MKIMFTFIIYVWLFSGKNDLLKNFFLIVIFLDIKYIKTCPYSNKILSQNFKPISGITGDYRLVTNIYIFIYIDVFH